MCVCLCVLLHDPDKTQTSPKFQEANALTSEADSLLSITASFPAFLCLPETETHRYVLHYDTTARLNDNSKFKLNTCVKNVFHMHIFDTLSWLLVTTS